MATGGQVAAPPTAAFILLATAVTLALARRWPAWSAPGHAAFAAIVISSTAFLVYAARTAVLGSPAMSGYDVGGGETVEHVQSPGAALGHGFRVAASRVSFAVTPGLEARRTTREEGPRATVQSELVIRPQTSTVVSVLGSYGRANRYSWLRGAVARRLKQSSVIDISLGAEGTAQGNADFQTIQGGSVLQWLLHAPALSIQTRAGWSRHSDESVAHPYFGVGLYRRF
jgi:beta-lactamase superfamily II metal-dependent hydrolase